MPRACSARVTAALALLAAAALPAVRAQCYLMDANADCAVCWKTVYGDEADKTGVTTMSPCPAEIMVTWDTPLPKEMFAMEEYVVDYSISVDPEAFEIDKTGSNHVPHANIHSCVASKGACTPFVSNSPGLATHTEALVGTVDEHGHESFRSTVKLSENQYTIIAHVRFFVKDEDQPNAPNIKYDVAIGAARTVLKPVAAVSADSWVNTGIACTLLMLLIGSVVWAARSGRLKIDQLVETIYSDEITITADIAIGVGDTAAYTLGVFTVIAGDHKLVQVLPAAYMFMILAWIGSLYNAYHDVHQLWDVYMQKHYRQKFFDSIAKRLARATVNKALKTGRKASVAGLDMRETDARTATQKLQASIIGESTQELEKHSRQEATMAYEMGVQDLRQPLCICKYMCDTYVCVCVYIYRQTDRQTHTHTHRCAGPPPQAWRCGYRRERIAAHYHHPVLCPLHVREDPGLCASSCERWYTCQVPSAHACMHARTHARGHAYT